MSNKGQQIVAIQNEDTSIKMLAAQKQLYTTAKKYFLLQCLIAVPGAILVSIISIFFKEATDSFPLLSAVYGLIASLLEHYLDSQVSRLKRRAATIQELFDHRVLGILWNDVKVPAHPTLDAVFRIYEKYLKINSLNKLYDWYSPAVAEVQTNVATVICQRTNCTYDFRLRRRYTLHLTIIALATFCFLLFISLINGLSLSSFISEVLFPSSPVFILAITQYDANRDSIENLTSLKDLLERIVATSKMSSIVDEHVIRQIQDKIYDNRRLSPLLPNWVFEKYRNTLEASMHFSVEESIQQLKKKEQQAP